MFALILDSLGSTELLFILVIALIFFGPRKLPHLARSMGKSMAEFRKASEDFKRTWEREVALESSRVESTENSILPEYRSEPVSDVPVHDDPAVTPVAVNDSIARGSSPRRPLEQAANLPNQDKDSAESSPKHEWL